MMSMLSQFTAGCWAPVLVLVWTLAVAQETGDGQALTGTLKKIKDSGSITLGYREDALPFSYVDKGRPLGYSLDLCLEIVEEIKAALDTETVQVKSVPVKPQERIPWVVNGTVDLECGSTTNTRARQREVAFSPVIFVTGTKLLTRKSSKIRSYRDLKGKTVAVSTGTTNEAAVKTLSDKQQLAIRLLSAGNQAEAFELFQQGRAEAFAADEVLLFGLLARAHSRREYAVVGDYLSYEPYGIVYRQDDPPLAAAVERAFARLMASRDILDLYDKWFIRKLPSGERLGLSMSAQLISIFEGLGLPEASAVPE